jgi:hypothetical protein
MNAPLNNRSYASARRGAVVAASLAALICICGAVLVVSQTVAAYKNAAAQAAALLITQKGNPELERKIALGALSSNPYSPDLLTALGLDAEKHGQKEQADRLITTAGAISWRDPLTDAWLFQKQLMAGNYKAGLDRADALLRVRTESDQVMFPVLIRAASDPAIAAATVNRLAQRPRWRDFFITRLNQIGTPEAAFSILSQLQSTAAPPTTSEASRYTQRLVALKQYDQALLSLYLFLPAKNLASLKYIYDGNFDDVDGIAPFVWSMNQKSGASLTMESPPLKAGDKALHIFYSGLFKTTLVSQFLVLPPGDYKLGGDSSVSAEGNRLEWTIYCVDSSKVLTEISAAKREGWQHFSALFTVPADCRAQEIELQSQSSEQSRGVDAWYDNLSLERIAG